MNELDLIHIQTRFVNDYLLTLADARRERDRHILDSVRNVAAAKCARSFRFPRRMQYDETMTGLETTID